MIKKIINFIISIFKSNVYFVGSLDKLPEPFN